jgi:hypothetical protein
MRCPQCGTYVSYLLANSSPNFSAVRGDYCSTMTSYVAGLNRFDLETVGSPEMPQTRPDMAATSVPVHISITSSCHTCVLPIVAQAHQLRRPARHRALKRGDRRLPHHSSSQNLPNRRVNSVSLRPGGNAGRGRTSSESVTFHW